MYLIERHILLSTGVREITYHTLRSMYGCNYYLTRDGPRQRVKEAGLLFTQIRKVKETAQSEALL